MKIYQASQKDLLKILKNAGYTEGEIIPHTYVYPISLTEFSVIEKSDKTADPIDAFDSGAYIASFMWDSESKLIAIERAAPGTGAQIRHNIRMANKALAANL